MSANECAVRNAEWRKDEAPKNRRIVALGNVRFEYSDGATSVEPFCAIIHWDESSQDWLDENEMSVRMDWEAKLIIHFWSEVPQ